MNPLIKQFHDKQIENLVNKKLAAGLATETATTTAFTLPVKGKKVGGKDAKKPKKKKKVERAYDVQLFSVGDTVDVHYKIIEGEKERIQIFSGIIIRHKGNGLTESITVRRIVQSEGVERIFPLHSPKLMKVIVTRRGIVRRAKLYFLRDRVGGKATKVPELLGAKADRLKKRDEVRQTALDQKLAEMAAAAEANKPETTES